MRLFDETTRQTAFSFGPMRYSPDQLRTAYYRYKRPGQGSSLPTELIAKTEIPANLLENLVQELHPILSKYMDSENKYIGNRLAHLFSYHSVTTIAEFTHNLVRATAVLGAEHTVELLFGWIEGKPLYYHIKVLLEGMTIDAPFDAPLVLRGGIQISRLPPGSHQLPSHVPQSDISFVGYYKFLNKTHLSIPSEVSPAFCKPSIARAWSRKDYVQGRGEMSGFSAEAFCEALSLAADCCIRPSVIWVDYGKWDSFRPSGHSFTLEDFNIAREYGKFISKEYCEKAQDIYLKRKAAGKTMQKLNTVILWWIKSKQSTTDIGFSEKLIDLRIALETLFLKGGEGEKNFRLAIHGAWYLGHTPDERCRYFETLNETYKLASKAIHAGEVEATSERESLLADAQKLCREGILKRLDENREPNWNKIILGAKVD